MPTALQRSRDILAGGVARARAGFADIARQQGEPGPEIQVQPFDAGNVSTPAALIKLGTSIAAARRKRANYEAAKGKLALEDEKTRAEIARLRAAAAADLRGPAAAATPAGSQVIGQGKYKGWTVRDATSDQRDRGLDQAAANATRRAQSKKDLASARAGLSELDKKGGQIERDSAVHAARQMPRLEHIFKRVWSTDPKVRDVALKAIDITPEMWETAAASTKADGSPNDYRPDLLNKARANLRAKVIARARMNVENYYRPQREKYMRVVDQGIDDGVDGDPAASDDSGIIEVDDQGNPIQ